jgi:hypothetical protein
MSMENRPDVELAKKLDMKAGIDGWHIHRIGMRGIASRVQIGKPWNSFTIRLSRDSGAKTEYAKRLAAIEQPRHGWMFPSITVQAYAESKTGPVISCGITKTVDIIQYIKDGMHVTRRTKNASFAVCFWNKMQASGYEVKQWQNKKKSRQANDVRPG